MSLSLCVWCVCIFYWKVRDQRVQKQTYLSQLKISDASTIFPTWVFSWLSFTILNFPLPICWICARNTWLECSTTHHAHTSSLCPCFLLNKMLPAWTLERSWVLYYNNFSLVIYHIPRSSRMRSWLYNDCYSCKKRVGTRGFRERNLLNSGSNTYRDLAGSLLYLSRQEFIISTGHSPWTIIIISVQKSPLTRTEP